MNPDIILNGQIYISGIRSIWEKNGSRLNTFKKTGYYCRFCGNEIHNFSIFLSEFGVNFENNISLKASTNYHI